MNSTDAEHVDNGAILFVDVCDSTSLFEDTGNWEAFEMIGAELDRHEVIARDCGGVIVRSKGDDLLCTFASADAAMDAAGQMLQANRDSHTPVRIGIHHGSFIRARGDIFGDAVNVAARLMDLATAAEGLVSEEFSLALSADWREDLVPFDEQTLKGKSDATSLYRLVVPGDNTTGMFLDKSGRSAPPRRQSVFATITFGEQVFVLDESTRPLKIGRVPDADVYIASRRVSRAHATVDVRDGRVLLRDRSSHGTLVVMQDNEILVRRETIHLFGGGIIQVGSADDPSGAFDLRFEIAKAQD